MHYKHTKVKLIFYIVILTNMTFPSIFFNISELIHSDNSTTINKSDIFPDDFRSAVPVISVSLILCVEPW